MVVVPSFFGRIQKNSTISGKALTKLVYFPIQHTVWFDSITLTTIHLLLIGS